MMVLSSLAPFLLLLPLPSLCNKTSEEERVAHFIERGYQWPPTQLSPETPGWRKLFEKRYRQIAAIENVDDKYNAWIITIGSSVVSKNFTETGWAMTRAPDAIIEQLKLTLHNGLANGNAVPENQDMLNRMGMRFSQDTPPMFIGNDDNNFRILEELKWMHEVWSGQELVPATAYGLRVYQNNSELFMHVDNPNTHIISSILHIDHSADSKPWPLVLEDFDGRTNEVLLTSGDLVFYESSKLFHGRPRKFDGSWYSSLFLHYYPKNWDSSGTNFDEYVYGIPPSWRDLHPLSSEMEALSMHYMGMHEPECVDSWCGSVDASQYNGPAKEGVLTTSKDERELKRSNTLKEEL
jgi:hypothetical protein